MSRRSRMRGWLVVVAAGVSMALGSFDANAATAVLPDIASDLGASPDLVQWVVLAYLIPIAAFALSAGSWFGSAGPRPGMLLLVGGFAGASVLAGFAPTIGVMIAARAVQGFFGAGLFSAAMVVALNALPSHHRPRIIAITTTAAALGGVAGPALGAVIAAAWGWPWVFAVCGPIGALIMIAFAVGIPAGGRLPLPTVTMVLDGLLIGIAVTAVLLALSFGPADPPAFLLALVAVPPLLLWWARSRPGTIGELLRIPGIRPVLIAVALVATTAMGTQFAVSFFAQSYVGLSVQQTGLALAVLALSTAVVAQLAVPLQERIDPLIIASGGFVLLGGAIALFVPLNAEWSFADVTARAGFVGVAQGLILPALSAAMFGRTPRTVLPESSAAMHLVRTVGFAAGPAVVVAAWLASDYAIDGIRLGLGVAAALAIVVAPVLIVAARARRE